MAVSFFDELVRQGHSLMPHTDNCDSVLLSPCRSTLLNFVEAARRERYSETPFSIPVEPNSNNVLRRFAVESAPVCAALSAANAAVSLDDSMRQKFRIFGRACRACRA